MLTTLSSPHSSLGRYLLVRSRYPTPQQKNLDIVVFPLSISRHFHVLSAIIGGRCTCIHIEVNARERIRNIMGCSSSKDGHGGTREVTMPRKKKGDDKHTPTIEELEAASKQVED